MTKLTSPSRTTCMTSICNGGDADVWQSLVVLVRPVLECAKTRNCTPRALASSGSYPERLKNAAQSKLPVRCDSERISWNGFVGNASFGSYPERLKNAAQSELPVGCPIAVMRLPPGV